MNNSQITVQTLVMAPIEKVWTMWTMPEHITLWTFASDDWEAPAAENDLRVGGKFKTVMAAKDKSTSFDFEGVYTHVKNHELIEYKLGDGRQVKVQFEKNLDGVNVIETFDPENVYPAEKQRDGWRAILNNFKKYVEAH